MAYKLYNKPVDMLKEVFFGGVHHDTFWALRDISLTVHEGERLGIVGHNGAGKSTLLQVITGNLAPTKGNVSVKGRISSLLSLVPAWNLEESGVENIRFNLLVQGVSARRIPYLVEEIVDFTELGPFITHPVKTYSSGMSARLAFAIATAIEPGILIIDEVLGAGDGYFAAKAYKRMQEFCARGKALLFVSHSTSAVQLMCNRALWIHNGAVRLQGEVEFVLKQYELDFRRAEDEAIRAKHIGAAAKRFETVASDEIPNSGFVRFRLVAENSSHFSATHYVRAVRIFGLDVNPIEVALELADCNDVNCRAALDLFGSEWGRMHDRGDAVSRLLSRATGRRPGGQFMVRLPANLVQDSADITVEVESASTNQHEVLNLEFLDMTDGRWSSLAAKPRRRAAGKWQVSQFHGPINFPLPEVAKQTATRIAENSLPDVEILDAYIEVKDERAVIVRERDPFDVCVRVLFRNPPRMADIGIKFSRADGVYVFWQSSGLSGINLNSPRGEKLIRFRFEPNNLGAGEYFVNASVCDGWLYPDNYPYAQIFARAINAANFRIIPEMPEVDFGVLNTRAQVQVSAIDEPSKLATGANA
jgi:lipopolysaccharide transport system ATP-binding protein